LSKKYITIGAIRHTAKRSVEKTSNVSSNKSLINNCVIKVDIKLTTMMMSKSAIILFILKTRKLFSKTNTKKFFSFVVNLGVATFRQNR
jgi:hypothetical protein